MYVLFDLGGTKTRVAVSRDGEHFEEPAKRDTPDTFEDGVAQLVDMASELAGGGSIVAAAGGVSGPLDRERTMLVNAPNLPGYNHKPLKQELERGLNVPVFIENDTTIVGLGEAHAGAGQGFALVVYLTVSTGVGGVRIAHGDPMPGRFGFEVGHQIIDLDGSACQACPPCPVCGHADLESMVSGSGVERRFHKKPYDIPQEDPLWEELAGWLAVGLNNTIVHWSPDVVVLGGSMIVGDPVIRVDRVARRLEETLTIFPEHPAIKRAELDDIGGIHGALAYVKKRIGVA